MINKVVIPAAGLGTRLLPATKELPKEMLPLFMKTDRGHVCVKPLLQIIFEELYKDGIKNFCFVTGRTKRSIEDHFTPDYNYIAQLKEGSKFTYAEEVNRFYKMLEESSVFWVNQPEPKGFGDAVLKAEAFLLDNEDFIVYAGDNYIISPKNTYLHRLISTHERLGSDATFLVNEVENPSQYGVIIGEPIDDRIFKVKGAIEKPKTPPSKMAIQAVYVFNKKIFKALKSINPDAGGELQLTDAIQWLIEHHSKIFALQLETDEIRIDIGSPDTYWQALKASYQNQNNEIINVL